MSNEEHRIQTSCVRWFRLQYPRLSGVFYAVPNGGARSAVTGAMLAAEGVLAGVSDLNLDVARGPYHGLRIEMKTPKGRLQPTQKDFAAAVTAQGYRYAVCRSLDDFRDLINQYLAL